MSNNVRIELDHSGIEALLKSSEMQDELSRVAKSRLSGTAGNYDTEVSVLSSRAVARIKPADLKTARSNLKHNTLVKMIK